MNHAPFPSEADAVDTSFPKGKMFAAWLSNIGVPTSPVTLTDTEDDVASVAPAGCAGASCLSTDWIYHPADNEPRYILFNTPVGMPSSAQCGRGVFSDVHVGGFSNDGTFPNECGAAETTNEKALEFLFFDLSTCVQDDTMPPTPPAQ